MKIVAFLAKNCIFVDKNSLIFHWGHLSQIVTYLKLKSLQLQFSLKRLYNSILIAVISVLCVSFTYFLLFFIASCYLIFINSFLTTSYMIEADLMIDFLYKLM